MKKILAIALALVLVLAVTGCGKKAAVVINTVDDLNGKTIGVQLGTTGDIYATDVEGATIERYNKGFEAVQALQQGKIDAVIIDDQPAKVFVSQNKDIKLLDEPFTVEEYAICVAKENTELLDKMNAAIGELKADGTLQKILDYHIGGVEGAESYKSPDGIAYTGKITMATNAEFPPYEYRDGDKIVGADVDFATAIADKLGLQLVVEDMAFDSIISSVQSGKADFGAAGMTVTEDRLKNINFTDSYCTASQVIIVKK